MTKEEFLRRMETEKPLDGSPYRIIVDRLLNSPYVIGCYKEKGIWKLYETEERTEHLVLAETTDDELAFENFYKQVYIQKNFSNLL